MMTPETNKFLKEYEAGMLQKREIETRLEALKSAILEGIPHDTPIKTQQGTFTVRSKKTWKYTELVTKLEERLKDMKKHEEAVGEAVRQNGDPYLVYNEYESNKGE